MKYDLICKKTYWLLLLGIIINFNINININPSYAQTNSNIAIDKNIINKPLIVQGISGGAITALEITQTKNTGTGYCDGFASQQPNHILKIDTFFDYLRLEVDSSADTTILVRGAGGVWCNDDAGSANPVIEGQWQPGVYQVWVGSYRANSNNNYKIKITGR
ncbi:hypothetical protein I4641_15105 [Waterburya agarophytonicola K14]|uniref:Uncharacterized protein n=1 Tax=Waterburya agarophytonicola KI4 TaxID=2874699 RepID=A0A964BRE3_9CYAN|nr:hypothetical protein [Waterburya agarophytonicola KI4]